MEAFRLRNGHLVRLKKISGHKIDKNEKLIQDLIEKNLPTIFPELEFLDTEYKIKNDAILDSIAFDNDHNLPVIIEYKNVKKKGVVEQILDYSDLLRDNKGDFLLTYFDKKHIRPKNVDFNNTRLIIMAPEFTKQQKRICLKHGIELYQITKYDDGLILLNEIGNEKKSNIAEPLPVSQGPNGGKHTLLSAAKKILEEESGPLHYKILSKRIMDRGLVRITGLKPWNSLRSVISVNMKGSDSVFTAPAKGMIGLKSHRGRKPSNNQYINAAIIILSESHKPLHYKDLTERAIQKGLIKTTGKTPWNSMASRINANMKSNDSVFMKAGSGMFGLKSNPSHMMHKTTR